MATRQETLRGRCGFDGVSGYFHCKDALFGILFMMGSRAANGRRLPVMTTALLCSIAFAMDRFAWKCRIGVLHLEPIGRCAEVSLTPWLVRVPPQSAHTL